MKSRLLQDLERRGFNSEHYNSLRMQITYLKTTLAEKEQELTDAHPVNYMSEEEISIYRRAIETELASWD